MDEKQRPKIGIAVLLVQEGKILLGKRKSGHGRNTWGPPGGHLEWGETPEQCVIRELMEETGITPLSIHRGPWCHNIIETGREYVTLFMVVPHFEGDPQNLEPEKCEGWKWFDWINLPESLFPTVITLRKEHPTFTI